MTENGAKNVTFSVGDWIVEPATNRLTCSGREVRVEPKVMRVLCYLVERHGEVVPRRDLETNVWTGMVVTDDAVTNTVIKLRKALGDNARDPRYIETIAKSGYRLIADTSGTAPPVDRVAEISGDAGTKNPGTKRRSPTWPKVLVIGLLAFVATWVFWLTSAPLHPIEQRPDQPLAEKPTIAVLPFENLSADPKQDYFADGIVEDVITDLSRIEAIRVLARSTSFAYKNKEIDPQRIAQELNVSHLVEGSVRRSADDLRITARLVDTSNGENLWSERYDRSVADIFEVQEDVAQNIVHALSVNLTQEQQTRVGSPPTSSFKAYDLYLKGRKTLSLRTPEANAQARDYYRQAILIDPGFGRAYGGIAVALTRFANKGWSDTPDVERDLALHYANKSVELNPKSPYSFWALGFTHLYRHENEQAAAAVREALRVAPGYADGMSLLALVYNYSAQAKEAIELINEAILINPLYSWDYLFNLGWAHYALGNYEKAKRYQQLALERNEYATFARLVLVASYMALDMADEAAWQVEEVLAYQTNMSIRFLEQETPIALDFEKIQQFVSLLRAGGIPPT